MIKGRESPPDRNKYEQPDSQRGHIRKDLRDAREQGLQHFEICGSEYTNRIQALAQSVREVTKAINSREWEALLRRFHAGYPEYDERTIGFHELCGTTRYKFSEYCVKTVREQDGYHLYVDADYELPDQLFKKACERYEAKIKTGSKEVVSKNMLRETICDMLEGNEAEEDISIQKEDRHGYQMGYNDALIVLAHCFEISTGYQCNSQVAEFTEDRFFRDNKNTI